MAKAEIHFGLKPRPIISLFPALKGGAIQNFILFNNLFRQFYLLQNTLHNQLHKKADKRFSAETSPDRSGYPFVRNEQKIGTDSRDTNVQQRFFAQVPKKDMRF